jgi:hypothetical protein
MSRNGTGPGRGGDAAEIVSTAMVFQSITASPRATGDQLSATTVATDVMHWLRAIRMKTSQAVVKARHFDVKRAPPDTPVQIHQGKDQTNP